jgi:tetratricopeptide (TPR) repeat protein
MKILLAATTATLSAVLAACAPNHGQAFERALAEGDRAETAGRYADAARSFDAAAMHALLYRDRTHAVYLAALMFERAGDLAPARERYEAVARAAPAAEDSGAAAYKEADMDIARGDSAAGWREMDAMLRHFPDDGLGKSAFHRLVRHEDETQGPGGALAYIEALAPVLDATERAEEVAYERAAHFETLGRLDEARDTFVRLASRWRYPIGALWDDSLYRAAELDRRLGRPKDALADLDAMLSQAEVSILNGSYTRPRYPDATMLAARIWRDDLHDPGEARKRFHAAYANFPTWQARDQALWLEADLWKTDGRTDEECGTLSKLVREFPDSRYVPCAAARCPSIARPSESQAPARCHAYIER